MRKDLTKSEQRVRERGEIFTPEWLVDEMLDKLPQSLFQDPTKTYLDPACGDGNILVRVMRRKIDNGSTPLQALQTTFGVDIMPDNIQQCRKRLFAIAFEYDHRPTKEWKTALLTNIRVANTLEQSLEEIFTAPLTDGP
jgi:hypothetical protein